MPSLKDHMKLHFKRHRPSSRSVYRLNTMRPSTSTEPLAEQRRVSMAAVPSYQSTATRASDTSSTSSASQYLRKLSSVGGSMYRKMSAAISPSTQRLTGFELLLKENDLIISIDRHEDFERAMRQATMNAEWNFDPIRFWVCNAQEVHLFAVDVCANEIVIRDVSHEQTKLMTIVVPIPSGKLDPCPSMFRIGKVRNASGFKMFSLVQSTNKIVDVHKYLSDSQLIPYIQIERTFSLCLLLSNCCGMTFDKYVYRVKTAGGMSQLANVRSGVSCNGERDMYIDYAHTPNTYDDLGESKAVVLAFALLTMIRTAYPQMATSMHEHARQHADGHSIYEPGE